MYLEQWDKAIERFEVNRKNKVEPFFSYVNLGRSFMAKGMYNKAKQVLEDYLDNFSDNVIIHFYLADNYLCQGKYDRALVEANNAFALNPGLYRYFAIKGDIYQARGDFNKAEEEYQKLLEVKEQTAHLYGRERLGHLYMLQGKFKKSEDQAKLGIKLAEELGEKEWEVGFHIDLGYRYLKTSHPEQALTESDKAWEIADEEESLSLQKRALDNKGLAYLEMESIKKAQKAAEELAKFIQEGMNKKEIRYYYHLMGQIALKRKSFATAVEYFRKAVSFLPHQYPWIPRNDHALFFDSIASAYYAEGDLEKAQREYERIISLTSGRLNYGDIYAKSFYMLGRICERRNWKRKARHYYHKFLDLWKEADSGIPELIAAKERLAVLENQ